MGQGISLKNIGLPPGTELVCFQSSQDIVYYADSGVGSIQNMAGQPDI